MSRPPLRLIDTLRDRADEAEGECLSLRAEVLALIDSAWPHLSALERMAVELGPIALRHALAIGGMLRRLEAQYRPVSEPDEMDVAA
jgi:hypothetical protein